MSRKKLIQRGVAGTIAAGLLGVIGTGIWNSDPVIMWRINRSEFDPSKYTTQDYLDAIIQIESKGNPHAERYERHMGDASYGLGQILTRTARELEASHSELPRLGSDVAKSLCDPTINQAYTKAFFLDLMGRYNEDPLLAVAAYNAGPHAPFVAACQSMLNDVSDASLDCDGANGPETKFYLTHFQKQHGLSADGKTGPQSWEALARTYQNETGRTAPRGVVPRNGQTPRHVLRFIKALKDDVYTLQRESSTRSD